MFNYHSFSEYEDERVRISLQRMRYAEGSIDYLKALSGAMNLAENIAEGSITIERHRDAVRFYKNISANVRKRLPQIIQKLISHEVID